MITASCEVLLKIDKTECLHFSFVLKTSTIGTNQSRYMHKRSTIVQNLTLRCFIKTKNYIKTLICNKQVPTNKYKKVYNISLKVNLITNDIASISFNDISRPTTCTPTQHFRKRERCEIGL